MPLLMCPNCQTEMKEVKRQDVLIDMCAKCHGIWLDRGELNKLLELSREDMPQEMPARMNEPQRQPQYSGERDRYDDRYQDNRGYAQRGYHDKYRKKSRFESIFDIFD